MNKLFINKIIFIILFFLFNDCISSILFYDSKGTKIDSIMVISEDIRCTNKFMSEFNLQKYDKSNIYIFQKSGYCSKILLKTELKDSSALIFLKNDTLKSGKRSPSSGQLLYGLNLWILGKSNYKNYSLFIHNAEENFTSECKNFCFSLKTNKNNFKKNDGLVFRIAIVVDDYHKIGFSEKEVEYDSLYINFSDIDVDYKDLLIENNLTNLKISKNIIKIASLKTYLIDGEKLVFNKAFSNKFEVISKRLPKLNIKFQLNNVHLDSIIYIEPQIDKLSINWDVQNFKYVELFLNREQQIIHSNESVYCLSNFALSSLKMDIYDLYHLTKTSKKIDNLQQVPSIDNEYHYNIHFDSSLKLEDEKEYYISITGYTEEKHDSIISNPIKFIYSKYYNQPSKPHSISLIEYPDSNFFYVKWAPAYESIGTTVPKYIINISGDKSFSFDQTSTFESSCNYYRISYERIKKTNFNEIFIKIKGVSQNNVQSESSIETFTLTRSGDFAYLNGPYSQIIKMVDSLLSVQYNLIDIFNSPPFPKVIRALDVEPNLGVINVGLTDGVIEGVRLYIYRDNATERKKPIFIGTAEVINSGPVNSQIKIKLNNKNLCAQVGDIVFNQFLGE